MPDGRETTGVAPDGFWAKVHSAKSESPRKLVTVTRTVYGVLARLVICVPGTTSLQAIPHTPDVHTITDMAEIKSVGFCKSLSVQARAYAGHNWQGSQHLLNFDTLKVLTTVSVPVCAIATVGKVGFVNSW